VEGDHRIWKARSMAEKGFGWRSIVAAACLLLAIGGIYKNVQHGIPANAPPGFAVGLYTPAALLTLVAIVLFAWEFRRQKG
jgi:hypothetical protein